MLSLGVLPLYKKSPLSARAFIIFYLSKISKPIFCHLFHVKFENSKPGKLSWFLSTLILTILSHTTLTNFKSVVNVEWEGLTTDVVKLLFHIHREHLHSTPSDKLPIDQSYLSPPGEGYILVYSEVIKIEQVAYFPSLMDTFHNWKFFFFKISPSSNFFVRS